MFQLREISSFQGYLYNNNYIEGIIVPRILHDVDIVYSTYIRVQVTMKSANFN